LASRVTIERYYESSIAKEASEYELLSTPSRSSSPSDRASLTAWLEDALQSADRGSPKYEKAAMRWLERYLTEGSPRLRHFAELTASLAHRERT
jgi:hypothetical protein